MSYSDSWCCLKILASIKGPGLQPVRQCESLTNSHAGAILLWTIGRVLQAVDLAPVVGLGLGFKLGRRDANLRPHDERPPEFARVLVVDGVGELLEGVDAGVSARWERGG